MTENATLHLQVAEYGAVKGWLATVSDGEGMNVDLSQEKYGKRHRSRSKSEERTPDAIERVSREFERKKVKQELGNLHSKEEGDSKKVGGDSGSLDLKGIYKKWLDQVQSDPQGYQRRQEMLDTYLYYQPHLSKEEVKVVAFDLIAQAMAVRHKALEVCP